MGGTPPIIPPPDSSPTRGEDLLCPIGFHANANRYRWANTWRERVERFGRPGYQSALVNFGFIANEVLTTDEVAKAMG
jgi:hypothetical protein